MIDRYADKVITEIWSLENKVAMWLKVELAVIMARAEIGRIPMAIYHRIKTTLEATEVDIARWLEIEDIIHHDLNAFVAERKEKLPENLKRYLHDGITSYDTEEPAFVLNLAASCVFVLVVIKKLEWELIRLAKKYCFTPMNARTHGQEAEMQSFGARCLTWLVELRLAQSQLMESMKNLKQSRLSGAIGKYGAVDPTLEDTALKILGLEPFYGATQIAPRGLYLPTAQALCQVVQAVNKIAHDIRLSARSGKPLMQEPFGKKQTGSSAMPQKKNTISTEKIEGLDRLARGYLKAIEENLMTWEERAIEQSSCERVAWPDLFHVTVHSVETLTKVLKGLKVYPDNMLWEILNSRGCYAAGQAKDWLKENGSVVGIDEDSAYRIVQLAAFNVHEPSSWAKELRENPRQQFELLPVSISWENEYCSIQEHIAKGELRYSDELAPTMEQVEVWNKALKKLFADASRRNKWNELFEPSHLLRNEAFLFRNTIGWEPGDEIE